MSEPILCSLCGEPRKKVKLLTFRLVKATKAEVSYSGNTRTARTTYQNLGSRSVRYCGPCAKRHARYSAIGGAIVAGIFGLVGIVVPIFPAARHGVLESLNSDRWVGSLVGIAIWVICTLASLIAFPLFVKIAVAPNPNSQWDREIIDRWMIGVCKRKVAREFSFWERRSVQILTNEEYQKLFKNGTT